MRYLYIFRLSVLIGMLFLVSVSHAKELPSFRLDFASWQATDIAILDEGNVIDGRLTVVETLQGDLKKDEVLVAPKLEKFADESWRTTGRSLFVSFILSSW